MFILVKCCKFVRIYSFDLFLTLHKDMTRLSDTKTKHIPGYRVDITKNINHININVCFQPFIQWPN